ncbi:MAG: hypothetical protein ACREV9_01310 [Burkholderiales bacterium]
MYLIKLTAAIIATTLALATCSTPTEHVPFDRKGNNEDRQSSTRDACSNCAVVEDVDLVAHDTDVGVGAVAGGIVGGVAGAAIGNEIGDDDSEAGAIAGGVAGAAAGAYGGHKAEQYYNREKDAYRITLRMHDGSYRTVTQSEKPGFRKGDRVRIEDDRVVAR